MVEHDNVLTCFIMYVHAHLYQSEEIIYNQCILNTTSKVSSPLKNPIKSASVTNYSSWNQAWDIARVVKAQSHIRDARPAHWKISNFGQCVVFRWLCVSIRYSFVERAGPTLCIRCHSLCASGFLCMHKNVRWARRMNALARRTPDTRRARWTNARHTRSTRWVFVVCSSAEV